MAGTIRLQWLAGLALILCAASGRTPPAAAQIRLVADPASSLAWWQVYPHMGHLWATTCPEEPTWEAGDEHTIGFRYDAKKDMGHDMGAMRKAPIPLHPRPVAVAVCSPAVRGEVMTADTTSWRGVHGLIVIRADALQTGLDMRDNYARKRVLQTESFPDIRFEIDSVVSLVPGDTLQGNAVGTFELHGVRQPVVIPIKAWHEPLGLRVTGQFNFPAYDLIDVYRMSKYPLSLGVGMKIWEKMYMGIDMILVQPSKRASQ
jgi:hypothetical protein